MTYRRNPTLVVYNPPAGLRVRRVMPRGRIVGIVSREVHQIRYKHTEDGELYQHSFQRRPGVMMVAIEQADGQRDVLLTGADGQPLWEDFGSAVPD